MDTEVHCQRCTACCRWPGEVRITPAEMARIASFLGLSEPEFIESHTRLRKDRKGLALKEQRDHTCIFLEAGACAVQPVKPEQCKDFPNGWVHRLWGKLPLEQMQRDFPMLFVCSGFKQFLQQQRPER